MIAGGWEPNEELAMGIWVRQLGVTLLAGAAVLGTASAANAQWRTGGFGVGGFGNNGFNRFQSFGYNPYYTGGVGAGMFSPYGMGGDPYGGYMQGSASVISAQGQRAVDYQKAYQIKEETRRMQIDNRRRTYDEWLYERANTPSAQDERERIQQQEARRARNSAPETEIWSGTSLNILLKEIQDMHSRGAHGPTIALNEDTLKQINVTTGTGGGNAGGLKVDYKNSWPVSLQTLAPREETRSLRGQIDKLMGEIKAQAMTGNVDGDTFEEAQRDINKLREHLSVAAKGDMGFTAFTEGRRFLNTLDDALKVLRQPTAKSYLDGKFAARGKTVGELIQHMTENGLRFSAAIPGEEAAYNALYRAMLTYDVQAGSTLASTGSMAPPK